MFTFIHEVCCSRSHFCIFVETTSLFYLGVLPFIWSHNLTFLSCYSFPVILSISLNARGLGNHVKRKSTFYIANNIILTFALYRNPTQLNRMLISGAHSGDVIYGCLMGLNVQLVFAFWKTIFKGKVLTFNCDKDDHHIFPVVELANVNYIIVSVHGLNSQTENNVFIDRSHNFWWRF